MLKEGTAAPDFEAVLDNGEGFRLSQYRGRKHVVLYFYPRDFTPGCTHELMPTAERFARIIAANGPIAVRKVKEAVIRSSGVPLEDAYKIENECAREAMMSEDAKEGPRAFMEKREPRYTGR
jgi:enoyl-CoA hydratase/carnithine racemase